MSESSSIERGAFVTPRRLSVLGALVVGLVVAVAYFPALGIGFATDDYLALDLAGRFSGAEYLARVFDPRAQRFWYRPMVGIQWKIAYILFRGEPLGYHLVQVAFHLANSLLLYALATRITRRWRIGLVAALIYGTWLMHSMAVYWPAVHDPLAGVFYLLTLWLWLDHLESGSRLKAALAYAAFVCAMLSKEVSITLPFLLLAADGWLVRKPASLSTLIKRYAAFFLVLLIYVPLQWIVATRSVFTQQIGYSVGEHIFVVFLYYLSLLTFPWELEQSLRYMWLSGVALFFLYACFRRDRRLLFLGAAGILPVLIVSPIPSHLTNPRYMYLPLMASAVGFGLLVEAVSGAMPSPRRIWTQAATGLVLALAVFGGSAAIGERVANFGGSIRQTRLQFRPVYQWHPTFAPGTFLYFVDTPLQAQDISGLMFLRYGSNVTVGGTDRNLPAGLRDHNTAFVYYLDDQEQFEEQPVDKDATVQVTPALPVQFEEGVSLEGVEIASASVKRGQAIVLIPYWRPAQNISRNYTVFAHLVAADGQMVTGYDSQPQRGRAPTTTWRAQQLLVDGIVIPIDETIPRGNYTVRLGLYHFPTMQRLAVLDARGQPVTDAVAIASFNVVD
jgi:hypothetical protein